MRIDFDVALEVASHEAIIRQAYKDSVGKWTWSVGLTSATGHNVERYIDKPQDLEFCLAIYLWALRRYADEVEEAFEGVPLTKEQFAAALSFHWNTGSIKTAQWVKDFKAGDLVKARKNFMNYNKPPEIRPRREKERALFFDGKWSNDGTMTEYTELTSAYTPKWSSAKKIDVREPLDKLLNPVKVPSPEPIPTSTIGGGDEPIIKKKSILQAIVDFFLDLLTKGNRRV